MEKNPADPEENKSRTDAAVGGRGEVHLEAGDVLLALPIEHRHVPSLSLQRFAISQGSVSIVSALA